MYWCEIILGTYSLGDAIRYDVFDEFLPNFEVENVNILPERNIDSNRESLENCPSGLVSLHHSYLWGRWTLQLRRLRPNDFFVRYPDILDGLGVSERDGLCETRKWYMCLRHVCQSWVTALIWYALVTWNTFIVCHAIIERSFSTLTWKMINVEVTGTLFFSSVLAKSSTENNSEWQWIDEKQTSVMAVFVAKLINSYNVSWKKKFSKLKE